MVQLILMSDCHFKWSFLHYGRSLAGHFKASGGKKALAFFRETLIFLNSKEIGELKLRIISLNTSGFCQQGPACGKRKNLSRTFGKKIIIKKGKQKGNLLF